MPLFFSVLRSVAHCGKRCVLKDFARCLSLKVGDTATLTKKITKEEVLQFADITGDTNPIHIDDSYVRNHTKFQNCLVHGIYLNGLVASVIGTQLPGPGTIIVKQELNFPSPCYVGEEVEVLVKVKDLRKIITIEFSCKSSSGNTVLQGHAKVIHRS